MRKICMLIFLSMISVNGFGASQTVHVCFNHAVCQEQGEGTPCGTNGTCKLIDGCYQCAYSPGGNVAISPITRCRLTNCELSDADKQWEEAGVDNLYQRASSCYYEYSLEANACVENREYERACASGYYVQNTFGGLGRWYTQCVKCPTVTKGNNPQSGDIQHGDITLNTSTSVTSCYLPKSDTQYEDASGTFVVTGDKCNATSQ